MPKYQVTGTMKVRFDLEVEADDEDAAVEKVEEMDYDDFDPKDFPTIDVDEAIELMPKKSKVG
jgi:hypothetical protein